MKNLALLHRVTQSVYRYINKNKVEYADLVAYGAIGLLQAERDFDPARSVKFTSYAWKRIRGAIFDGLRTMDHAPRHFRKEHGATFLVPFNSNHLDSAAYTTDPLKAIIISECIAKLILGLTTQQKYIVRRYFYDNKTMKEIGKELGVSESRICQLMAEIKTHMKSKEDV